ncbi:MAG: acyl carrier protein [Candidatus Marinimicrobia bacterium]|nr:acyl carrier protein [Candidatus Neomarinimicrobiota bacterium]
MNTFEKVKEIIMDKLGIEESKITPEAKFIEDLGTDSLGVYELIVELEEEFKIEVPAGDEDNLKTVGDVVKYVEEKTQG